MRTRITEVGPGSLAYRGHDVRGLAGTWTFEQVRDLLTGQDVGEGAHPPSRQAVADTRRPGAEQAAAAVAAALPVGTPVLDRFKHAVLVAGGVDVGRYDRTPESFAAAGGRAADAMVASLTGSAAGGGLAVGLGAYLDLPTDLLDTALVLLADHDLAVSTTAVRVAVSAGSDAYSALLVGLAAADSPLHLRAVLRAVDWLRAALLDPRSALDAALTDGPPPGFGHVVYTEQDPRAQVLLERLLPAADPAVRDAVALLEAELLERRGWVLSVDAALALLTLQHDLPRDTGAVIFACARTAGWTAHAIEELAEPGMRFRLRGIYTGPRRP